MKGKAVAYCAEAVVLHSHNYTGIQQFKRNFDLGVSQADHPEIFQAARSESEGIRPGKADGGLSDKKEKAVASAQAGFSERLQISRLPPGKGI